jgi:hypothetical protein
MENHLSLRLFIEHAREGTYFTLPFALPPDVEELSLTYRYERHSENHEEDSVKSRGRQPGPLGPGPSLLRNSR